MAIFRWDIVRKSDGKVTHSLIREQEPSYQEVYGPVGYFDIIKTDITDEKTYLDAVNSFYEKIELNSTELLIAVIDKLNGDSTRWDVLIPKYNKAKQDIPVPPKPKKDDKTPKEKK